MQPTVRVGQPQVVHMAAPGQRVVGQPQMMQMGAPSTAPAVYTAAPRIVQGPTVSAGAMPARTVVVQQGGGVPTYAAAGAGGYQTIVRPGQSGAMPVRTVMAPGAQVVQAGQPRPHTLAGPVYTQGAYETKHQDDPQLKNLKELRANSGLKHVPVSDGLMTLKEGAVDGKLGREEFLVAYAQLLATHNIEAPGMEVQNAVFDLFDRDDNNIVDMMELICGISLLCSGTEDDKIHAVFNVFDENGDGFISMDEMFKFLTSVFKVVLTPNVMGVLNSMGVTVESAEDLASVTALECFKTADLNHDGKLNVDEFKKWFYAPRNDPAFLFSPVRKLLQ